MSCSTVSGVPGAFWKNYTYDICASSSFSGSLSSSAAFIFALTGVLLVPHVSSLTETLTQDAHDIVPLANLVQHCIVSLLQQRLLAFIDLLRTAMHSVHDVLQALHRLVWGKVKQPATEPWRSHIFEERDDEASKLYVRDRWTVSQTLAPAVR